MGGTPLFLEDHLERFARSAALLHLDLPTDARGLEAHIEALVAANDVREAGVQLFLTGGVAADGFTPSTPTLLCLVTALPQRPARLFDEGARLITAQHVREMPEAKTTNYQRAVRLAPAMRAAGAADALYHDGERALETTRSNLFVVTEAGRIVTPGRGILAGVTRRNVLRALATSGEADLAVEERDVPLDELAAAREVFITSTTKGALPIVRIDDRAVGDGRPGPVTARVRRKFAAHVEAYLAERRG